MSSTKTLIKKWKNPFTKDPFKITMKMEKKFNKNHNKGKIKKISKRHNRLNSKHFIILLRMNKMKNGWVKCGKI